MSNKNEQLRSIQVLMLAELGQDIQEYAADTTIEPVKLFATLSSLRAILRALDSLSPGSTPEIVKRLREINMALEAARDAAQLVLRENSSDLVN